MFKNLIIGFALCISSQVFAGNGSSSNFVGEDFGIVIPLPSPLGR